MNKLSIIQVPSRLDVLEDVLDWFELFKRSMNAPRAWMECQLALTEAFTNVVRHAHQDLPDTTPVQIRAKLTSASLELSIWDQGPTFDFEQHLANVPEHVNNSSEGGRGLFLIKAIANEVRYISNGHGHNALVIVKNFTQEQPDPSDAFPGHTETASDLEELGSLDMEGSLVEPAGGEDDIEFTMEPINFDEL